MSELSRNELVELTVVETQSIHGGGLKRFLDILGPVTDIFGSDDIGLDPQEIYREGGTVYGDPRERLGTGLA